jgi:hypothetical protein
MNGNWWSGYLQNGKIDQVLNQIDLKDIVLDRLVYYRSVFEEKKSSYLLNVIDKLNHL